jgi:hypothetical protein
MIAGGLLDVDATLLDSNDAHARPWVEALEGVGLFRDPADLLAHLDPPAFATVRRFA